VNFDELTKLIREYLQGITDNLIRQQQIQKLRLIINEVSPLSNHPVDLVRWIPIERVKANDYNPNQVAKQEMHLLYHSIKTDGYTQPIVVIKNKDKDEYIIVDGFHRYFVAKSYKDISDSTMNCIPVTVINKEINERMASTIRHNRARGEHKISGMSKLVYKMLENGWSDADICNEIGLEAEELLKLKHLTGFAKLFENVEYRKAWETKKMIKYRLNKTV